MSLPEEFHALAGKVNNWGRWGPDDERGTLNLLTDEAVRRGVAQARTGKRFTLAIPLSEDGPQLGFIPGRTNPVRTMISLNEPLTGDPSQVCFNDDRFEMGVQAATHWDALAHASYDGRIYNGFGAASVTEAGAARCGIDKAGAIVGRGVLLDVARARGLDRLEPGYAITGEDLDAAAELARVRVSPGDLVLVRTGQMRALHAGDKVGYLYPAAGLSMRSVAWMREHDVAAAATDTVVFEVYPYEREDMALPVHLLHLVEMGLTQGQNFDLEALADDCADDGVYTFLLHATPEPLVGGLGGPVAPLAVK
ncbi:cyclase family protein [Frankia sp. CNm7]|uniref:Cyclase family protein n=1 Tax=Frankia nepalensis TaxID=1836974 RepID=A0A937RG08_9ACTN|nr:cyclase family protein [Frankia nepalensis]MBL7513556.1 cyclase family protein [Frankia nepalensis]MBL7524147.1 cyclase family protein [Frankia nepalensis]MBL7628189.1 cyclase family protein [Frankia nepalensis]